MSAFVTPPALELPIVLQHAPKGFQPEVTVDLDEAAARERLGFNFGALLAQSNALITRPEARVALVEAKTRRNGPTGRSFAARETALKQELACLCRSEKGSLEKTSCQVPRGCRAGGKNPAPTNLGL